MCGYLGKNWDNLTISVPCYSSEESWNSKNAGDPYCSPSVVKDLSRWYREACDLARDALNCRGSYSSAYYESMVERLKDLDSRCIL